MNNILRSFGFVKRPITCYTQPKVGNDLWLNEINRKGKKKTLFYS